MPKPEPPFYNPETGYREDETAAGGDSMSEPIETMNDQLVAMNRDQIVVMNPNLRMTVEQALRQAAWLVAITGELERFQEVLQAVCNT